MSIPTFEEVKRIKHMDSPTAQMVLDILTSSREELEEMPLYEEYYQKIGIHMYHDHSTPELKMQMLDILLDGYGVEGVETPDGWIEYVNFGDTYNTTICYFDGDFLVTSWGEIYEQYLESDPDE